MLASAVPAKRGVWKTVKLADGTEIRVELRGDEFCKFWQTEDGRRFVRNQATGLYEAADMASMAAQAKEKRNVINKNMKKSAQGTGKAGGNHIVEYKGKKKGLIILVQFSDVKFEDKHTRDYYNRVVNEIGFNDPSDGFVGSVKDYYLAQSNNQMEFDFDVIGPITLNNGYAYYGRNVSGSDDIRKVGMMVQEACMAAESQLTEEQVKQYDWDGDGIIDQIFLLYAGYGEATPPFDDSTIWPHMFYLRSGCGITHRMHGILIDTYACSNERQKGSYGDTPMGIGTICHEFSHCLGLADMYDTAYGTNYGTYAWDLMCSGCYNGDTFIPAGYTAFERMSVGWQESIELNSNQSVDNMLPLSSNGDTYIIYNDGNKNEYYMLENRKKEGWDAGLPGEGLLITHIDYNAYYWNMNIVNNTPGHERASIIPADNSKNYYNAKTDTYPYSTNNSLTSSSRPAATLFNKNKDGSYNMNKSVKDITKNSDGTISFTFENENDDNTGISGITADGNKDGGNRIYSIDGRYMGKDINALKKGIYIINGKKIVK